MTRIKVFTAIVSWLLLAAMVSSCSGSSPAAIVRTVASETLVTQIVDAPSLAYSPDARRVAYVADRGGKKYVVVDGVPGKKGYDAITDIVASSLTWGTFSPNSKHVAYIGITYGENPRTDRKWSVVIDGEEGDAYSSSYFVTFSPDSKHVAYVADGIVFLDRVPVKGPEGIARSLPLFSPDSQHLVYVVEQSGGKSVVLDGVPGKQYGIVGAIAFSPDSKHLAYRAMTTNVRWVMVVDGREESQYESDEWHLQDIVFSPDSSHLAYVAGEKFRSPEHRHFIVLDGKELTRHKESFDRLIFSLDSNHLAYDAGGFIFVDGVEKGVYKGGFIGFMSSPDSPRLAYADIKTGWWDVTTAA